MEQQQEQLLNAATKEFEFYNISQIVTAYKPILDEFCAVSEHLRSTQTRYNEIFEKLIGVLCEEYDIKRDIMYVRLGNYSTNIWGNLYWRFLHLTSILLEHSMYENRINDPLDFPLLVYNIDHILPCSTCTLHYRQIKETAEIKATIKDMSFGMLISGLQAFHNLVTQNVDKTPEYANMPNRVPFTMLDFARTYHCIERLPDEILKSKIYVRPRLDWQPNTHRMLTIFYAIANKHTYSPSSDLLKLNLYHSPSIASTVTTTTTAAVELSQEKILNSINQAILMNVDEHVATGNAQIYNQTIVEFYHAYPDYVRKLVEITFANVATDDENKLRIKTKIEELLSKVTSV
nr:Ac92-like protein [Apis mellifera nudivirus]